MKRGTIRKTIIRKGKAMEIMVEKRTIPRPCPAVNAAPKTARVVLLPLAREIHNALRTSPRFPNSFWAPT